MQSAIDKGKLFYKEHFFLRLSENVWEVGERKHLVTLVTKSGRSFLTCDCKNNTRYCTENSLCSHISAVMFVEFNKNFFLMFDKIKGEYERIKRIKLPIPAELVLDDLDKLYKSIIQ